MWILEAFLAAGVQDGLVGVIHDPALAAEAHVPAGHAASSRGSTARAATTFCKPFTAEATVVGLRDQAVRGRRGIYANNTLDLGLSAALRSAA